MKLGKYFTLDELTSTNTGLLNVPTRAETKALSELVKNVLDPAREKLGMPIRVSSGYRSTLVNKKIGGATNSQHIKGEAADIGCNDNAKLFNLISDTITFDQLIWEFGDDRQPSWVHVSYNTSGNRKEVLRAKKSGGKTIYEKI